MISDPVFRIALALSLAAHLALVSPWIIPAQDETAVVKSEQVELDYIIVRDPMPALEEEQYEEVSKDDSRVEQAVEGSEKYFKDIKESREIKIQEKQAYLKYLNLVREKIRSEIYARRGRGAPGSVRAVFTVSPDGSLSGIEDVSDASVFIRRNTVKGIEEAAPFPPFPTELGTEPLRFSLNVRFER